MPERWQKIRELFHAALELDGPQRTRYLDQACARDESLRQEVEVLLSRHGRAGSFLESPVVAGNDPCLSETPAVSAGQPAAVNGLPDHSLRREVEALLAASDDVPSSFLKSSPNADLRLSKGTRLGDFEILSLLGAGGMGEVYRARDRRLERDVALKVLPRFVSLDPERLRRFEQEAKTAAALNHSNILAVFQMGTYEGAPYLVSELLEGETLREQLKHGPVALGKAIDYGVQIARVSSLFSAA